MNSEINLLHYQFVHPEYHAKSPGLQLGIRGNVQPPESQLDPKHALLSKYCILVWKEPRNMAWAYKIVLVYLNKFVLYTLQRTWAIYGNEHKK
jgi:hypothetical protein